MVELVFVIQEVRLGRAVAKRFAEHREHEAEAKRYLDWLLTPAAQAEMSRGYFRPAIAGTMPREIAARFLPASEYRRVRDLPLADSAAAADALKKRWTAEVRGVR